MLAGDRPYATDFCSHELQPDFASSPWARRQANGSTRQLVCLNCPDGHHIVPTKRTDGVGLWAYLATAALYTSYGQNARRREKDERMSIADLEVEARSWPAHHDYRAPRARCKAR